MYRYYQERLYSEFTNNQSGCARLRVRTRRPRVALLPSEAHQPFREWASRQCIACTASLAIFRAPTKRDYRNRPIDHVQTIYTASHQNHSRWFVSDITGACTPLPLHHRASGTLRLTATGDDSSAAATPAPPVPPAPCIATPSDTWLFSWSSDSWWARPALLPARGADTAPGSSRPGRPADLPYQMTAWRVTSPVARCRARGLPTVQDRRVLTSHPAANSCPDPGSRPARSSFILRITFPQSSVTPPLAGPSGRRPPGMWRSPEPSPGSGGPPGLRATHAAWRRWWQPQKARLDHPGDVHFGLLKPISFIPWLWNGQVWPKGPYPYQTKPNQGQRRARAGQWSALRRGRWMWGTWCGEWGWWCAEQTCAVTKNQGPGFPGFHAISKI